MVAKHRFYVNIPDEQVYGEGYDCSNFYSFLKTQNLNHMIMNHCPVDTIMGVDPECLPLSVQEDIQESESSEQLKSKLVKILNNMTMIESAANDKDVHITVFYRQQLVDLIDTARKMLDNIEEKYLSPEKEQ